MLFLLSTLPALAQDAISTIGILKRAAADSGCRTAWFLGTEADNPHRFCLNLATMSGELSERVEALYDEEVAIEGHFEGGAVSLTRLSTALGAANGERPSLDYHLDPVTSTRSHDLGARLRESPVARIRIHPPATPVLIELILQGVPMEADVAGLLERIVFRSGTGELTPAALMLGTTLVLTLTSPPSDRLLTIQPRQGDDLVAVLTDGLFDGDLSQLSMTLLLSPVAHDTPIHPDPGGTR